MKRIVNSILLTLVVCSSLRAQGQQDSLSFKNRIGLVGEENFFKTEGYYNWCPSLLKDEKGIFHLFYSRWKKVHTFLGWLTHSEIAHAAAKSPVGPWTVVGTVLTGRGKGYWDAITMHNPKIEYFNGKYYLYYISTNFADKDFTERDLVETETGGYKHANWKILRSNQRTGVAVADNVNGPWERFDKPLIEPSGPIATITVNPGITKGKDGKFYLIVKGDKPNSSSFIRNQAMAIADSPTGPFLIQPKPVIDYLDTEDMSLWYDKNRDHYYGVFHSTQNFIGLVSSRDGINWFKAHDYMLMPKELKMKDGQIRKFDKMERPFIYLEKGEPKTL